MSTPLHRWIQLIQKIRETDQISLREQRLISLLRDYDKRLPHAHDQIRTAILKAYPRSSREREILLLFTELFYYSQQGMLFDAHRSWVNLMDRFGMAPPREGFLNLLLVEGALTAGEIYCDLHDFSAAQVAVSNAQNRPLTSRQQATLNFVQAVYSYRRRDAAAAQKCLQRCEAAIPRPRQNQIDSWLLIRLRVHALRGQVAALLGNDQEASEQLGLAMVFAEKCPRPNREKAHLMAKMARIFVMQRKFNEAMVSGDAALEYATEPDVENKYLQALAHQRIGEIRLMALQATIDGPAVGPSGLQPIDLPNRELAALAHRHFLANARLSSASSLQNQYGKMIAFLSLSHLASLDPNARRAEALAQADNYYFDAAYLAERLPAGHPGKAVVSSCRGRLELLRSNIDAGITHYAAAAGVLTALGLRHRAAEMTATAAEVLLRYNPEQLSRAIHLAAKAVELADSAGGSPLSPAFQATLHAMPPAAWLALISEQREEERAASAPFSTDDVISGIAHTCRHVIRDMSVLKHSQHARQSLTRLQFLTELLLQQSAEAISSEHVDLNNAVLDTLKVCEPLIRAVMKKKVHFDAATRSISVYGPKIILQLAFEAIIRNALEHGKGIAVNATSCEENQERLFAVHFTDPGKGLPRRMSDWLQAGTDGSPNSGDAPTSFGLRFIRYAIRDAFRGRLRVTAPTRAAPHTITASFLIE
jgi:hypothetical protein